MTILFKYYRSSSEVNKAVLYLSSFLPHSSVAIVASFCMSRLRSSTASTAIVLPASKGCKAKEGQKATFTLPHWTEDKNDIGLVEVSTYINALCNWGRGDDILELVGQWLAKDLENRKAKQGQNSPPRKKSRGVRFQEAGSEKAQPGFALVILRYILSHQMTRAMLLRKNLDQLKEIHVILKSYLPLISEKASEDIEQQGAESDHVVLASAFLVNLKLAAILHLANSKANQHEDDGLNKCT